SRPRARLREGNRDAPTAKCLRRCGLGAPLLVGGILRRSRLPRVFAEAISCAHRGRCPGPGYASDHIRGFPWLPATAERHCDRRLRDRVRRAGLLAEEPQARNGPSRMDRYHRGAGLASGLESPEELPLTELKQTPQVIAG